MKKIILSMLLFCFLIAGCGLIDKNEIKIERNDEYVLQDNTESWKINRSPLEMSLEHAFIQGNTIYGYYWESDGLHIVAQDIASLSETRDIIVSEIDSVEGVTVDGNDDILVFGCVGNKEILWKINQNNQVHIVEDYLQQEILNERRITRPAKGFFADYNENYYLWYEVGVQANLYEAYKEYDDDVFVAVNRIYVMDKDYNILFYEQTPDDIMGYCCDEKGAPIFVVKNNDGIYVTGINIAEQKFDNIRYMENLTLETDGDILAVSKDSFLFTQGSVLYEYRYKEQKQEKLLDLASYGMFPQEILYLRMNDEKIEVIDTPAGNDVSEYSVLKQGEQEQAVISIGIMQETPDITETVTKFNRLNNGVRVQIVNYYDEENFEVGVEKLKLDIVKGKAPDIIDVSMINYELFADKKIFRDLYEFMDTDTECSRDKFITNILENYEINGELYSIAPAFQLYTIWGKPAVIQGKSGVSFDELLQVLEENGKGLEAIHGFSADEPILKTFCAMMMDEFVNWENKTCDFYAQNFQKLLHFTKQYSAGKAEGSLSSKISDNKIVLSVGVISSVQDYQLQKALYGGEIEIIGYPARNSSGTQSGYRGSELAINAKSENAEYAWGFLKFYIMNAGNQGGFPILKDNYDDMLQKAQEDTYIMTEEGPIITLKASYSDKDSYFEIYAAKPEEVNEINEIVHSADRKFDYYTEIYNIIEEEASGYIAGEKSMNEVLDIINSRVGIYLQE